MNRELGPPDELALSLGILGGVAAERGDIEAATAALEESAALAREIGDTWQRAWTLRGRSEASGKRAACGHALGCGTSARR